MKMTYLQYIQNPMGIKNAVYSQRDMYRDMYTKKLDSIMVRESGKIEYHLYNDGDKFYIHMKVPSEVVPKFYYDVVVEYYTEDNNVKMEPSLDNYLTRFYSNDPMFVFTFAHAFIKNDMFIEFLKDKMSKKAINDAANERNPQNIIGYVKSIYFAFLLIKRYGLNKKIMFTSYSEKLYKKGLLDKIEHADSKIEKRQSEGLKIQKERKVEKSSNNDNSNRNTKGINVVRPITVSKTTNKARTVKTTSTIKRK